MAPSTTGESVAKLWNLCNVLKDDGVTYQMAQETGQEQGIPEEWRWTSLERLQGIKQLEHDKLVSEIDKLDWYSARQEGLGDLYEVSSGKFLLAKAFRGELVPQDPGDEPASALLARIRAARQAGAGAAKPLRRGRPKAAANPAPINRNAAPVPSDSLPPDLLACLLRECGPLSERALLAASELRPETFRVQLARKQGLGAVRESREDDQVLLEAVR
jgi:hypothetical protein